MDITPPSSSTQQLSIDPLSHRLYQAVYVGSPFDALTTSFITLDHLLKWLVTQPLSVSTMIAYRAACLHAHPHTHYVDGVHFIALAWKDEYTAIYYYSGGRAVPIHSQPSQTPDKLDSYLLSIVAKCATDTLFSRKIMLICNNMRRYLTIDSSISFSQEEMDIVAKSRSSLCIDLLLNLFAPHVYIKSLVAADHIAHLMNQQTLLFKKHVFNRCLTLRDKAPLYWDSVAKSLYEPLFKEKLSKPSHQLSREELQMVAELYPSLVDKFYLNLSPLAYKISLLKPHLQSYLLGLPFETCQPSPETINNALQQLSAQGIKEYVQTVLASHRALYTQTSSLTVCNDKDTLTEDPLSYSPFDTVKFTTDDKLFFFTRPEFEHMLKTGKNHWTNSPLPLPFLQYLEYKLRASYNLELPSSKPLDEVLSSFEQEEMNLHLTPENSHVADQIMLLLRVLGIPTS